jgi:glycosyltransferase involved in cell wall biosynthesis
VISVIVPAHNEARVIGRLLSELLPAAKRGDLEIIVVANGCLDNTVDIASSFQPDVRVLSIPDASKRAALAAGDQAARAFPRVYLDADVEVRASDLRELGAALDEPGVLAAAPDRVLDLAGRPWTVRWYYDVWARLPEVRRGLFGRGVIALSVQGHERFAALPPVLADDLALSLLFTPPERRIVPGAQVVVHTPRTLADLLRRRVRAAEGVAQIERVPQASQSSARTRLPDLLIIAGSGPLQPLRVGFFLTVALFARLGSRRSIARDDYSAWRRDESSRDDVAAP